MSIQSSATSSLVQLNELSQFGARKQNRLPILIKLLDDSYLEKTRVQQDYTKQTRNINSMPILNAQQLETNLKCAFSSLPTKINVLNDQKMQDLAKGDDSFRQPEMNRQLVGETPSLKTNKQQEQVKIELADVQSLVNPSFVGDSLIEMIIKLSAENQDLVRALDVNNKYVKERICEFKRLQEGTVKRDAHIAKEKADFEHSIRKLTQQNNFLNDRLKLVEAKLKNMNLEVNDTLEATHLFKFNACLTNESQLYPKLDDAESLLRHLNEETQQTNAKSLSSRYSSQSSNKNLEVLQIYSEPMQDDISTTVGNSQSLHAKLGKPSKPQMKVSCKKDLVSNNDLSAADDALAKCDKLEKKLNELGRRDYEICRLQQQLNIYRQDFKLERMTKVEAKSRIETLETDTEKLCFDRVRKQTSQLEAAEAAAAVSRSAQNSTKDRISGVSFIGSDFVGKLGHQLQKKAIKTAARAARYAAKKAHLEEKIAARNVGHASTSGNATQEEHLVSKFAPNLETNIKMYEQKGRNERRHFGNLDRSIGSEIVGDLVFTANKAVLTGYKMASTHANLAIEKLNQFEKDQVNKLHETGD